MVANTRIAIGTQNQARLPSIFLAVCLGSVHSLAASPMSTPAVLRRACSFS